MSIQGDKKFNEAIDIRRVGEVARLMNDAGLIVISAFISPFRTDREHACEVIGHRHFVEVHVSTSLAICESRDPKGSYQRARAGRGGAFTGISSPYEVPDAPQVSIDTAVLGVEDAVAVLLRSVPA